MLEDEYGQESVLKLLAGAMEESSPDAEAIRIQLPTRRDQPMIPLIVSGEREGYDVAVFTRGDHVRETNIIEFIFRKIESSVVDEEEIRAKAALFRPGLRYS